MTSHELAERVQVGLRRKQVVLGKERMISLAKRGGVGMVWATEDLSRHSRDKVRRVCEKHGIPLHCKGESAVIGAVTGEPNAKVYILKKSFSGLGTILRHLADSDADQNRN